MSDRDFAYPMGNPWTARFLFVVVIASVLVTVAVSVRSIVVQPLAAALPLAAAILALLAWVRLPEQRLAWTLLVSSAIIAATGLWRQPSGAREWLLLVVTYALVALYHAGFRKRWYARILFAPPLFALVFLNSAAMLGNMGWGGFPAVFAFLLTFIIHATHELERRTPMPGDSREDPHVHLLHRRALAWISIVFFLFGVIAFWPWLGKVYGHGYFWTLIIGVLAPLLYLWGRLRQPRKQNSLQALRRFNRLVPYVGLAMLLAIALG